MRKYAIIVVVLAVMFTMVTLSQAAEKTAAPVAKSAVKMEPQSTCPVSGDPINKEVYTDYQGKRVYFCCQACPPEFAKNPDKYMKVLADKGQEPEAAPVTKK